MSIKHLVIDSNVYLSALIFGANPRQIVETTLFGDFIVVMSEEIYTEMKKVVTAKFPMFLADYSAFETILRENTVLIKLGSVHIDICRDKKDNLIIETAIIGSCNAIITGDKDLLSLGLYKNISIITPVEAIKSGLIK